MANPPRESQIDEYLVDPAPAFERPVSMLDDASEAQVSVSEWKKLLNLLRQRTMGAIEQLSAYLHRRKPSSADSSTTDEIDQHLTATLESFAMRQDSLEALLEATYSRAPEGTAARCPESSDVPPEWAIQLRSMIADQLAGFEASLRTFGERLETRSVLDPNGVGADEDTFIQSVTFPAPAPATVTCAAEDDLLSVMLGPTLCGAQEQRPAIQWLNDNMHAGNPQALALVGQLLVFRCASPERKPSLLKELGEAYYRCFRKTRDISDPFEDAIAAWSKQHCDEAGLSNWVELVHVGERFDSARHSPVERGGVEVAEVLGWVVLRDGGRVYSKALVQTR